jgi:hypothetical protein
MLFHTNNARVGIPSSKAQVELLPKVVRSMIQHDNRRTRVGIAVTNEIVAQHLRLRGDGEYSKVAVPPVCGRSRVCSVAGPVVNDDSPSLDTLAGPGIMYDLRMTVVRVVRYE